MANSEVVAKQTGRPLHLVGVHLCEELVMLEAMLEQLEKTLADIVQQIMTVFGNRFHVSTICQYFQRNNMSRMKVKNAWYHLNKL